MEQAFNDANIDEDPKCAECHLAIEEGSVVAFGDHIWHVQCFRCAKCGTLVDHDSNLLLLSNGKPICENCSYNCRVCDRKIDDLAIMTGDESYHSECFRCRLCYKKIEDLVFAKTSQGIYCIACHNDRMSKNRKQKQSTRAGNALLPDLKDKTLPSVPSTQTKAAITRSRAETDLAAEVRPDNLEVAIGTNSTTVPITQDIYLEHDQKSPSRSPPAIPMAPSSHIVEELALEDSGRQPLEQTASVNKTFEEQDDRRDKSLNTLDDDATLTSKITLQSEPQDLLSVSQARHSKSDHETIADSSQSPTPSSSFGTKSPLSFPEQLQKQDATIADFELPIIPPRSIDRSHTARTLPVIPHDDLAPPLELTAQRNEALSNSGDPFGENVVQKHDIANSEDTSTRPLSPLAEPNNHVDQPTELPSTPRISHKRDFSSNVTPANHRHGPSKSLETSPNLAYLGASVTTFEGDLSNAFNLSPRNSISQSVSTNPSQLERSNTISRLANRMLKHRKSVSGSALSPKGSPRSASITNEYPELLALQQELKLRNDKIIELEANLRHAGEAKNLEKQVEHRKSYLATLQTQIAQSQAETTSYLHHRHRISDVTVPFTEWKANVVADVEASLKNVKNELSNEIEELIKNRNELRSEVERLNTQKSSTLQEIEVLQQRHDGLTTINNNMLKKIQAGMVAHKDHRDREPSLSHIRPELPAKFAARSPSRNTVNTQISETESGPMSDSIGETETLDGYTGYAIAHDIEEEDDGSVGPLGRTSGDSQDTTPKKFNFTKKAKKAFRWGRGGPSSESSTSTLPNYGIDGSYSQVMTSSKSNDRINAKTGQPGLFKRTWQSQNNLASHLNDRAGDNGTPATEVKLFGTDLCLQASLEARSIPQIVTGCIGIIEARALDFEGLYRKSGGAGEMKNLIDAFETANINHTSLDFSHFNDISAITSVLKQYLRRLPVPLITYEAYESFISTSALPDPTARLRAIRDIFRTLPPPHYETLKVLFNHLNLVSQHCAKNLMTPKNLAVVLGPTVIWDQNGTKEITDMLDKNLSIQFLIEYAHEL